MLSLRKIVKNYVTGDEVVHALKGVDIDFRKSEFVSILGPSGCGKTTLLNIVGGLDKYTDGDLVINGKSTKDFDDRDWDTYRNHTVGFVFQSYNLIPHQTVLENVELALTLSGVSKKERKERAAKALEQVGLKDQIKKRPNQLSGGQMQRVAIARALVNDPDIILADEPTGALDTETSVQIMNILKNISNDKLIIMVTHNPELAESYSNRIIRLVDGEVKDDSNPYKDDGTEKYELYDESMKTSMSFTTALSLSLKNLFTKKARTILTSFAGSIGIIGIATILSMSSGFENYIAKVEEDTLSTYPVTITETNMDYSAALSSMMISEPVENPEENTIYVNNVMSEVMKAVNEGIHTNDLKGFKAHVEENKEEWDKHAIVQYNYGVDINVYTVEKENDKVIDAEKIVPFELDATTMKMMQEAGVDASSVIMMMNSMPGWSEMINNQNLLESQYDIVGEWPDSPNEVVVVVDKNNTINDFTLCSLGLENFLDILMNSVSENPKPYTYTFDEILNKTYHIVPSSAYYQDLLGLGIYTKDNSIANIKDNIKENKTVEVKVSGIVKQKENATAASINGVIGYTHALVEELVNLSNNSDVVKAQRENENINVLTGLPFECTKTMETNLTRFGQRDLSKPSSINIYPKSFEDKDKIEELIGEYNLGKEEENQITYTDYIGLMMSSVSTIINAISYVLIGFVSISLVVSSIMIGIITYISVLERTKEIGVLRAIGASKKDISRVFNAEAFLVGLVSGILGIVITLGIDAIINIILYALVGLQIAKLPVLGAFILIGISVALSLIAGLIPSGFAAKRDPVIALRSE